jgi:hypothetical protein
MAMSISPAQMIQQVASAESAAPTGHSSPSVVSATDRAVPCPSAPQMTPPAPVLSPSSFSTDMQVDNDHQIYYAVVDDSTGDVLFEIPSEALRKIGESLNVPLIGDANVPSVDVKS